MYSKETKLLHLFLNCLTGGICNFKDEKTLFDHFSVTFSGSAKRSRAHEYANFDPLTSFQVVVDRRVSFNVSAAQARY